MSLSAGLFCLFSLFTLEFKVTAMEEDVLAKTVSQMPLEDLRSLASVIHEGNMRIEAIALAWGMPTDCASHNEIAKAADVLKTGAKELLARLNRFPLKLGISSEERNHTGLIYYSLATIIKQHVQKNFCQDVKYYKGRASALSTLVQLVDLLQDFEICFIIYKKNSLENDTALIEQSKKFELAMRNLIYDHHQKREELRTFYEAVMQELHKRINESPKERNHYKFNKYFHWILTTHLHDEQVTPLPTFGDAESSQHAQSTVVPQQQVLSKREINAQVNELMKQFATISPKTVQKSPGKRKKHINPFREPKKIPTTLDVYYETDHKPTIALMSQARFGKLEYADKISLLFDYQDYWFSRIFDEQSNPSALVRFMQKIYSDHEKHKKVFDRILDLKHKYAQEIQEDLMYLQELISHAIQFHSTEINEHDNQEKIQQIAKKYAVYMINIDAETQALKKVFGLTDSSSEACTTFAPDAP